MKKCFIFFFFFFLAISGGYAQQEKLYKSSDGISGIDYDFCKDQQGFLWIGTSNGLHKFDGQTFTVYTHTSNDSTSLTSNYIESVFEDSKGRLWVGSNSDLQILDRSTNRFKSYPVFFNNKRLFIKYIDIAEDKKGNVWVATNFGLLQIDTDYKHRFFLYDEDENGDLIPQDFTALLLDQEENLWVGTKDQGLYSFNTKSYQVKQFNRDRTGKMALPDNSILSLCLGPHGNILIGTLRKGILLYNTAQDRIISLPLSSKEESELDGGILSIVMDQQETVWVGTERNGLKKLDPNYKLQNANSSVKSLDTKEARVRCFVDKDDHLWLGIDFEGLLQKKGNLQPFHSFTKDASQGKSLSHPIVKAIYEDVKGTIWIGTDGGGLNKIGPQRKEVKYYKNDPDRPSSIADNAILSICEDKEGSLWFATYLGGLSRFNPASNSFTNFELPEEEGAQQFQFVMCVIPATDGGLWLGMNGGGVKHFNPKTNKLNSIRIIGDKSATVEIQPYVKTLLHSKDSTLWIGTYNGLFAWNKQKSDAREYSSSNSTLEDDAINCLFQDHSGAIWFGTANGLHTIDAQSNKIITYTQEQGLAANRVYSILEDDKHNLWLTTSNGLSKFLRKEGLFRSYYTNDGLPANEFVANAHLKSQDGQLYFGSTSGLIYFHPDSIEESSQMPKLVLTQLKIFNEPVPVGEYKDGRQLLSEVINATESITLAYSDNNFMLEFAAIDFAAPEKIRYAYQLEGFDPNWIYTDNTRRHANYTNLDPGCYTFKVKNTNTDGVWSDTVKTLRIVVTPPFYKTWWAYTFYFLLLVLGVFSLRWFELYKIKMKQALQIEKVRREKVEEINEAKMQFFSNVSHEFRTPISLIFGPLEKLLMVEENPSSRKYLSIIQQHSLRLLRLVNQLLDVQKVENQQLSLKAKQENVVLFAQKIMASFEGHANQSRIHLELDAPGEELLLWFDAEKMEKILYNLIYNAFKATPEGGFILVTIKRKSEASGVMVGQQTLQISVSDTGVGIPQESLEKIFHRFYQVPGKQAGLQTGTGIGLHLTKKLVELHKGEIQVESKLGEGSKFMLHFPFGHEHLLPEEMVEASGEIELLEIENSPKPVEDEIKFKSEKTKKTVANRCTVLVIEDDHDIRRYLAEELAEEYEVIEAKNGIEGLALAQEKLPDLVVSDIGLPELSGIEVLRSVKENLNTAHIPVIMLTARGSMEDKLAGVEIGADDYISKPFNTAYLKLKVKKLIETRERLKQQFSRTISFDAKEMTVTSADERFLQKSMDYVKANLSDPELNIEEMGREIGVSRVHLYRKLKSLTGQSPSEFIRTIRLKQAAYLLSQQKLNVSEIAYSVGFNSLQYFSNSFHDYFQISPSAYAQREMDVDSESEAT